MMAKLNRKIEYALIALNYMKGKPTGVLTAAKEICDTQGIPFDATARVLQVLAQRGILLSEQGAHGGYHLVRDLEKVSIFELIEVVSGPVGLAKCLQVKSSCDLKSICGIRTPLNYLNARLAEFYNSISVGELLRMGSPDSAHSPNSSAVHRQTTSPTSKSEEIS